MATRVCAAEGCSARVPAHSRQQYHTKTCRDREAKRRYRQRKQAEVIQPNRIRRGDVYATLEAAPELVAALRNGDITQAAAARALGVSSSTFSESYATFLAEGMPKLIADDWEMGDAVKQWLAVGEYDYTPGDDLEAWLDRAVEGFVRFRHAMFRTSRGPYLTRAFHKVWIRGVLKAIITGGRYMVLSPPRHGKSELLVHFVCWLIARNPDIRIVWISGNEEIAKDMVGHVKGQLESNQDLINACLPPGVSWAPQNRNKARWGVTKLTVANRTMTLTGATLTARGRGGKVLSMNVDALICDDIEDFDSTANELERGKTRHWMFNTLESRKEDHTAWVVIGSRQHPDDLYDYLLADDEWETQVDSAHSPTCILDPYDLDAHVNCMLFPDLRSYAWLWSKRNSAESQGLLANFEMVYLNDPRPAGLTVYDAGALERSKNHNRGIGTEDLQLDLKRRAAEDPHHDSYGYYLIAGLDPSATGFQAAFLWAYVTELNMQFAIDIDNRRGGGIYQSWELMRHWHDLYGVQHWVYEDNGFQREYQLNREFLAWRAANDILMEPHSTQGGNKHNPLYGLTAQAQLYDQGLVDLPWGTAEAREKMSLYLRQCERYVDNADKVTRVKRPTDLHMASWFPQRVIRRLRLDVQASASGHDEFSFVDFSQTEWSDPPW